jgi:hypothetical protein
VRPGKESVSAAIDEVAVSTTFSYIALSEDNCPETGDFGYGLSGAGGNQTHRDPMVEGFQRK